MRVKTHPPTFTAFFLTALLSLVVITTPAIASDLAKEKRWAEQVTDSLLDGEAIMLNDGSNDFLAIDTRAEEAKDTGIIVIHGIGIHPDWETVIRPLRVQLAESGWNTLSLQMPILGNEAKSKDYEPLMKEVPARIDAGIRQLAQEGAKRIVIVAHSMGSRMTNYYLAHKKRYYEAQTDTPIVAYIAIGMNAGNTKYLRKIKMPVIDIFGEKDLPGVIESAPKRAFAAGHNKKYSQVKIKGANHFFEGQDDDLVEAVKAAIEKL